MLTDATITYDTSYTREEERVTTIYLIRHGETAWNAEGRWQGHADVPLNDTGRAQARQLAAWLRERGVRFDAIYSSDLHRAWETAAILAQAQGLEPRPVPALREIDLGRWSGKTRDEVMASDREILDRIASGEDLPRGGAERMADLFQRVIGATEALVAEHPRETIALVSHGGPIRALLLYASRDRDGPAPRRGHIGNTAVSILDCGPHGWALRLINDVSHLEGGAQAPDLMAPQPPGDEEVATGSDEVTEREQRAQ
jgi:broad specificity phosphatase PhoE